VREQRHAVALRDRRDPDDMIDVPVRAEDVRDADAELVRPPLELALEPVRVDQDTAPARALGDEVRVRQPVRVLDALD
jgi:hypothetical protein